MSSQTPVIQLKNVSKTFGEVRSLSGIDLEIYPGEIVGLLGDNGAGKSTLVKIIMGFHKPDDGGEIWFKGEKISDWSVSKARAIGIETIYQERALCEQQPIWRNMFMGREITNKFGKLNVKAMKREASKLMSEHMGFTSTAVHPDNPVQTMSGGEKQGVAITRALYFEAELVILDEPTVGLSLSETRKALDFVQNIKKSGRSAIFIDHNIFHIYPAVDRMIILDRGMIAGNYKKSEITMDELVESMYRVARTGTVKE
jgi:simple sugar transport system ATP-binding protein